MNKETTRIRKHKKMDVISVPHRFLVGEDILSLLVRVKMGDKVERTGHRSLHLLQETHIHPLEVTLG